jgi:hypothetical protein
VKQGDEDRMRWAEVENPDLISTINPGGPQDYLRSNNNNIMKRQVWFAVFKCWEKVEDGGS